MSTIFAALLDANVLYPAPVRDLLLELAYRGLYRAKWTNTIHEEWIDALLRTRSDLSRETLINTREKMNAAIPDCLVENYEELIEDLKLPDSHDRHVLAAAIRGRADVIVTQNLKDFPEAVLIRYGIEAQHPDEFINNLLSLAPEVVYSAVRSIRARLRKPRRSADEYIDRIEAQGLTMTASILRVLLTFLWLTRDRAEAFRSRIG